MSDLGYYDPDGLRQRRDPNFATVYAVQEGMITKGDNILDVGCGTGRDTAWLHREGYNVEGFDSNELHKKDGRIPDFIELGKEMFGDDMPIYESDMRDISHLPDGTIDVFIVNGFFHASNLYKPDNQGFNQVMSEIDRLAKPGARLIGHEFSDDNDDWETRSAIDEWGCMPGERIVELLDEKGYERIYVMKRKLEMDTGREANFIVFAYSVKD